MLEGYWQHKDSKTHSKQTNNCDNKRGDSKEEEKRDSKEEKEADQSRGEASAILEKGRSRWASFSRQQSTLTQ